MDFEEVTIEGEVYDAVDADEAMWLVRWFKKDGAILEAEIWLDTADPEFAIHCAISRGNWKSKQRKASS